VCVLCVCVCEVCGYTLGCTSAMDSILKHMGAPAGVTASPPLMARRPEVHGHCVPRPAVAAEGVPPFLAHELCREIIGVHPCDRRRPTAESRAMFPGVGAGGGGEGRGGGSKREEARVLCHSPGLGGTDDLWGGGCTLGLA
jgi:hypothetical protein